MVGNDLVAIVDRSLGRSEADKLCRDSSALVHQLIEAVLAICSGLAENDRTSVHSIVEPGSILAASLTIALHVKLLNVGRESQQGLAVRQDRS